jgi:hypothetical protein
MADVKPGANYITANRFYVEMGGDIKASFTECSGISVQIEKDVYLEGGVNDQQRIFLKQSKFQDITLKRGMTNDLSFWGWVESVLELTGGKGVSPRRNAVAIEELTLAYESLVLEGKRNPIKGTTKRDQSGYFT